MNQPGVECADCVQIREVKVFPDKVYLYAVPYPQDERGMGGPVLEMFISSPKEDILRTQAFHFMGSAKKEPQFELDAEARPLEVEEFEGGLSIKSGKTELRITKNPASFVYYYEGKYLTRIGDRFGHAMISTLKTPEGPFMRVQMDVGIGEKVYGLGGGHLERGRRHLHRDLLQEHPLLHDQPGLWRAGQLQRPRLL